MTPWLEIAVGIFCRRKKQWRHFCVRLRGWHDTRLARGWRWWSLGCGNQCGQQVWRSSNLLRIRETFNKQYTILYPIRLFTNYYLLFEVRPSPKNIDCWNYERNHQGHEPSSTSKMQAPVVVMSRHTLHTCWRPCDWPSQIDTGSGERQVGRKAQISNITAAKTWVTVFILAHEQYWQTFKSRRYHSIMSRAQSDVEDVARPYGRNRSHQRWSCHTSRDWSRTSCSKEYDRTEQNARWRSRRWHNDCDNPG